VDLATFSGLWPANQRILLTAVRVLDAKCMARQGFGYPTSPTPLTNPEDEAAVIDLAGRERKGYGLTTDAAAQPSNPYFDSLSPAVKQRYELALLGPASATTEVGIAGSIRVRTQGCEAGSRRELAGDVVTWARIDYIPQSLNNTLVGRMTSTQEYRAALSAWRSCMAAHGYPYATPEDARKALAAEYSAQGNTPTLRQREIVVAVVDGKCAAAVHFPSAAARSKRALVASLPAADRASLEQLAKARGQAIAKARAVLATEAPGLRLTG
jgi:hypothetical protein